MRAEIWRVIIGTEEERHRAEDEKWAEWAAAQVIQGLFGSLSFNVITEFISVILQ
jgi:hypothetical protein